MPKEESEGYQIHLNFLSVKGELPAFTVHRKPPVSPQQARPTRDVMACRLPRTSDSTDDWATYWVSIDPREDFEPFRAEARLNPHLTCRVLFAALLSSSRRLLRADEFTVSANSFLPLISFIQRTHDEGDELLEVEARYLRAVQEFGFLVGFHFRKGEGVPFSRNVQRLSLSLDASFRRNLNCYIDRDAKVRAFVRERHSVFGSLTLAGTEGAVMLADDFLPLRADRLRTKSYVFADNLESRSQFTGLRDHGPLKPLEKPPRLLFIFREQDRSAARMLAQALRGSRQRERFNFPGFSALFKCEIQIDPAPLVLADLGVHAMEASLARAMEGGTGPGTLPVLVVPADSEAYALHKALFTKAGIATQVCTLRILQDEDSLKWAIANLALQIFCKAGGYPWKVRPAAAERTLIIGISQSHKMRTKDGRRSVERYFAFSVMTDSSGLFQSIQVMSESEDQGDYLAKLRQSLSNAIAANAAEFSRVVVHTSFKLKQSEMDSIQSAVAAAAENPGLSRCGFAVVKVNHPSHFFGVNRRVNSLVPYESTRLKLGPREYLVWFEGIFPDRPTVTKAFPGPTHVQITRVAGENPPSDEILLQDLVNLSGANWRGFNAKSAPVSVFYCHLVADMVQEFYERGLPPPEVKHMTPWFL